MIARLAQGRDQGRTSFTVAPVPGPDTVIAGCFIKSGNFGIARCGSCDGLPESCALRLGSQGRGRDGQNDNKRQNRHKGVPERRRQKRDHC